MEIVEGKHNIKIYNNIWAYKLGDLSLNNMGTIDTNRTLGCMSTNPKFYEEGLTKKEIREKFLQHRKNAAAYEGFQFDPKKFFRPSQTKDGSAVELTKEMVESYEDGWDLDIPADILVVTHKTPGVVAGYPVADCPVLIASDLRNGITATAHCGTEMIDRELPRQTIEMMQNKYNSKLDEIYVYIGSHAGSSWTCDSMPKWATNENLWKDSEAIKQREDGSYQIDLRKALLYQFESYNFEPEKFESFLVNNDDTITNPNYYSNSAARKDPSKAGKQFTGAYYKVR